MGNRAVGLGERPFLDPNSPSRREALGQVPGDDGSGDPLPNESRTKVDTTVQA